jgi:hypothetical protein
MPWLRYSTVGFRNKRGETCHHAQPWPGADAVTRAAQARRVCRTWHRASGVKVPVPDIRGVEG